MFDKLYDIKPEVVDYVRRMKTCPPLYQLPQEMVDYILQLDRVCVFISEEKSLRRAAKRLQDEYPALSFRTCQQRAADGMKYLYSHDSTTMENWYLFYADMMMERSRKADEEGKMEEARRCIEKAVEYTEKAIDKRVDPAAIRYRPQLISPDVTAERMGLDGGESMRQLRAAALQVIEARKDISDTEKERLRKEVNLEVKN